MYTESMMVAKSRWFVITNWNQDTDYLKLLEGKQISFAAVGRAEHCPTTGKVHEHVFMRFHNPQSTSNKSKCKIGKMFGKIQCHVEEMRGNIQENEAYVSKDSNGELSKYGEEPKQGFRGDLKETKDEIMKGKLVCEEIVLEDPHLYHLYGRTLEKIEAIQLRRRFRTEMTKGIYVYGVSGSGKSHYVFRDYDPNKCYIKNLNDEWWDGYTGQEIVIFNEFSGPMSMRYSELMDLVDKWPKTVKQRCREPVPFLAKEIRITSVKSPYDLYNIKENDHEFNRRFTIIKLEQKYSEGNNRTSEPLLEIECEQDLYNRHCTIMHLLE